jgi:zinc-ribbon domain
MFCPQCGQQQASEEARFCSRCGLRLDALAEFIEGGGQLAAPGAAEDSPALTPRQRGTRKGALLLAGGFIFTLIALLLTAMKHDFFVFLILAAFIMTAGIMRVLYGILLEDDSARKKEAKRLNRESKRSAREELPDPARDRKRGKLAAAARAKELHPPRAAFTKSGAATGEMAAPPSVTEGTTRLLED